MCITEHFFQQEALWPLWRLIFCKNMWSCTRSPSLVSHFHSGATSHSLEWTLLFWAHCELKRSLRLNVLSDSVDIKQPSFFFYFHHDLMAHFGQLSSLFDTAEPHMNTKASLNAGACWRFVTFYLNLVKAFSSRHDVSLCVWPHVPGGRKLECMFWFTGTVESCESHLMVYFWCNDWEKWPTCQEFWLLAIKVL